MINFDLESTPLEIKTESALGSDKEVRVWFYTAGGSKVGGVKLLLASPPQYLLVNCHSASSYTNFPVDLPREIDKVWTIFLSKTPVITLEIHCNDVEVLHVRMSDTCTEGDWNNKWSKKVEKIRFGGKDTASDHYRMGKIHSNF